MLQSSFPGETCAFFPDPLADWDRVRIHGKKKSTYEPDSRLCFRWGLFRPEVAKIEAAFDDGVTIGVVPRYGYDVYAGAVMLKNCHVTLALHRQMVEGCVRTRPIYVFKDRLRLLERPIKDEYFEDPGQRFVDIDPDLRHNSKRFDRIIGLIGSELEGRCQTTQAA